MTKENPLLKSQNEERLSRRTKTYGLDESDLKDNVRKKNLEAYASPSKKKRISNQKETLNDLIQKRKSVVKEEDNDMNKSSILFRNKTNNFNNNNPLAMSQQIKTPKKRVLGLRDINTEDTNNRYDKEEETKPIVKNRFSVRHSINYFTNNNLFDKETSPRLVSKQSKEMQLNESDYPKEPISPSSFRRRRKERTNTGKESLIALNEIGENFEENTKKSRLERKREEEEKKKQQEKEEQEKREKERQERREKREKERKEREEKEEKERIQREKEKKEREAQREKERKEKERKEKERQEKERLKKEREEKER
jgi:hypothetical protein